MQEKVKKNVLLHFTYAQDIFMIDINIPTLKARRHEIQI